MADYNGTNGDDVFLGTPGSDSAIGNGGNDQLSGAGDNDYLEGDDGDDVLNGGDGDDSLWGGPGNDHLSGGSGDDDLFGEEGDDVMVGGDGNDFLRDGPGVDSFDGGSESAIQHFVTLYGDQISFADSRATQGVVADLRTGQIANDGFGNAETMTGIESLGGGTAFADRFYGNDGINYFDGALGDTLMGFGGDDVFLVRAAPALVDGGEGTDRVELLLSGSLIPNPNGGSTAVRAPTMTQGYQVDLAAGTLVDGNSHSGTITGVEQVVGSTLADVMLGSAGDDWFAPGAGSDTIDGRGGVDTVSYAGDPFDYWFSYKGGMFIDLAVGQAVETFADHQTTGSGYLVYGVPPTGTTGSGATSESIDTLAGIENVAGTGLGDTIYGDGADNRIAPGAGNDVIDGRGGSDTIDYSAARAPVEVRLDLGAAYEQGTGETALDIFSNYPPGIIVKADDYSATTDQLTSIENAVGSAFADTLVGDGGANRLEGGAGNDVLDGAAGADRMLGGSGDDVYVVDDAGDVVIENAGEGTDEIRTALANYGLTAANVEKLTGTSSSGQYLSGDARANIITGGTGGDYLVGNEGDDHLDGGGGDDHVYGNDDNDVIAGGDGNDTLQGGKGSDVIDGGEGQDRIDGDFGTSSFYPWDSADTLSGGGGDDTIYGGGGDDSISGGDGKDYLVGGLGHDVIDGGEGHDFILGWGEYASFVTSDTESDVLNGGGGDDTIFAGYGDSVDGGAGVDRLILELNGAPVGVSADLRSLANGGTLNLGGATLSGIEYVTFVVGTAFDDVIIAGPAESTAHGASISGGLGNDDLTGTTGRDDIYGGDGDDIIRGMGGVDPSIYPSGDRLSGEAGNDIIYIGGDGALASGGTGDDIIYGGAGDDEESGDSGADRLYGGTGTDGLQGWDGDDILVGDKGADYLTGGSGTDTADYSQETGGGAVIANLSGAAVTAPDGTVMAAGQGRDTWGDIDVYSGMENVRTGAGNDAVYGGAEANRFETGAGSDTLSGGGGDDVLDGGTGADAMIGGLGNDIFYVDNADDVVTENAGEGTADEVRTGLTGYVLAANVEKLTWTGAGGGDVRGNGLDNVLNGGTANDFIRAQDGGNDTVSLGAGDDAVYFGAAYTSADVVDGGSGKDQLALQGDYSGGVTLGVMTGVETLAVMTHSDTRFGGGSASPYSYNMIAPDAAVAAGTQLLVNASVLQAGENLTFDGSAETNGSFFIYGGKGVDTLTGGSGADVFFFAEDGRFAATDHIDGGAGQDVMVLRGNYSLVLSGTSLVNVETVVLNSGSDARFYAAGTPFSYDITTADDTVAAGQTMTFNGGQLSASETLHFDGSLETNGNFRLFGGSANDVIKGGAGNDLIYGGLGQDDLTGGSGADTFRYQGAGESTVGAPDRILDFASGDVIDLGRIDAVTGGNDDAFHIVGAFDGQAGELVLTEGANNVWTVSGDVDGNGQADFQILVTVSDGHLLGTSDFVL
jgi:Ca2+-binding RTX toxin-like protein